MQSTRRPPRDPNWLLRLARASGKMLMLLMLSLFEVLGLPRVRALNSAAVEPPSDEEDKP